MPSELSVMILCGHSPRHWYVANRLCSAARPLAIVQETGTQLNWKKVSKLADPQYVFRKCFRWLRERKRYAGNREAHFFFGDELPRLNRPDLIANVPHINDREVVNLADRLQPDLIAVFGTSLIRGELLNKGRLGMVNLHGGLSPYYRGADCTFWALYNNEPDKVGCTIHFIDPGIDTGRLIAHICPEIHEGDDEFTLFWRAVKNSGAIYAELIERLAAGERLGKPQGIKGTLYQVKDRQWRHERILAAKIRSGLLRGVALPRRVTWFSEPA